MISRLVALSKCSESWTRWCFVEKVISLDPLLLTGSFVWKVCDCKGRNCDPDRVSTQTISFTGEKFVKKNALKKHRFLSTLYTFLLGGDMCPRNQILGATIGILKEPFAQRMAPCFFALLISEKFSKKNSEKISKKFSKNFRPDFRETIWPNFVKDLQNSFKKISSE